MKEFVIGITETLSRNVAIRLDDDDATADEAVELAEELCNSGDIDLNGNDFLSRNVQDETEDWDGCSRINLRVYNEDGEVSPKDNGNDDKHMVVEVCPFCEREIYMRWNVKEDGYVAYCPHCGDPIMLFDECMHRDGNDGGGPCDFNSETNGCYRCPEGRVLSSRKSELLDNAIAHLTKLAGRAEIENTLRCIGFTDYEMKMLLEVNDDE